MNKFLHTRKLKFIGMSLLWGSLLYACVIGVFSFTDGKDKKNEPVSYTQTSSEQANSIQISVDSLQRKISITHNIFHYLIKQLKS